MLVIVAIFMTLLVLNIIVISHEFGHYITAKKFGVGIKEFSIGMGPVLFQRRKKENRFVFLRKKKQFEDDVFKFSIRAFPIGGFVKLKGESEENSDADSFSQLKPWKRLIVFLSGALMNFALAILCFAIIGTCYIDCDISTKVSSFDHNISESGEEIPALSEKDGLKIGDEIVKINNNKIYDITDIQYELALADKTEVDVEVIRDGKNVTLQNVKFPYVNENGMISMYMDFNVSATDKTFGGTMKYIGNSIFASVKMVYRTLYGLISGNIPISSVSGVVGVTATVNESLSQYSSFYELSYQFFYLIAVLSINIGLFNILPIPALDGGQSCVCAFEMVTKKKVNEKVYNIITGIFLILLFVFMGVITLKDILQLTL